eukprot:2356077-Prymnesium_polylepis.1
MEATRCGCGARLQVLMIVRRCVGQVRSQKRRNPDGRRQQWVHWTDAERDDVASSDVIFVKVGPISVAVEAEISRKVGRAADQLIGTRVALQARLHLRRIPIEQEGPAFWR